MQRLILTNGYFDGVARRADGPYAIMIEDARIRAISPAAGASQLPFVRRELPALQAEFVLPGLVEAHAHVFLDGGQLDPGARAGYLDAPFETMMAVARRNLAGALRCGVTLVRDAGDRYGVNHAMRAEARAAQGSLPELRSAGAGIRRPMRYGGFIAHEAGGDDDLVTLVNRIADDGAEDLKIVLTGIIDFASGRVKGDPQFDEQALSLAVATARDRGLRTLAHCSGLPGLQVAVAAGVDSVEHGFFMNRDVLARMAAKGIAWVPTCSPVHFQWQRPEIAGWDEVALAHLRRILDDHLTQIALAHAMGVNLIAGSDAGSHGVCHGRGLLDELFFFLEAGLPLASVLEAATSRPRRLWGIDEGILRPDAPADLVLLAGDPFRNSRHLLEVVAVVKSGQVNGCSPA